MAVPGALLSAAVLVMTVGLPPIGVILLVAYGYVLFGIVRGEERADAQELRHHLRRRGKRPD